jgi:hypothetical protein
MKKIFFLVININSWLYILEYVRNKITHQTKFLGEHIFSKWYFVILHI